ncbi:ABC-type multidrug transport system, ATPase and permease component [Ruminococcus sp. XPD3002]|nr:ABC-type multidrug transport system, ATPase and permease component [Ruminococcus flavefaciens]
MSKIKAMNVKRRNLSKQLKSIYNVILKKRMFSLILISLMLLTSSFLTILTASKMAKIIDSVTAGISMDKLIVDIFVYIAIVVFQNCISFYCGYCNSKLILKSINELKTFCLNKIFSRSGEFFSNNEYGELYTAIESDTSSFCGFIMSNIFSILYTVSLLAFYVTYLAILNWKLLLAIMAIQPLVLIFQLIFAPKIMKKSQQHRDNNVKYDSILQTIISNPVELIMSGMKEKSFKKLMKSINDTYDSGKSLSFVHSLSAHIIQFLSAFTTCLVIGLGGYFVLQGKMTIGVLVVFISSSDKLIKIIASISDLTFDFSEVKPIYKRLSNYLNYTSEDNEELVLSSDQNDIVFQNVDFSYDEGTEILRNVNCCFKTGKKYGIIGKTGEGKSTIIKLLFNLWKPSRGKILIGGKKIDHLDKNSISESIMYVSANPIMFNDTIYNNIVMNSTDINEERIYDMLRKLKLYDDITKLNDNIQSVIGDNGTTLSTGQRQRLAIARALLSDKQIIIMDEPTSSIDSETEKEVMKTIYNELSDKTLIIITHDEQILYNCDEILELRNRNLIHTDKEIADIIA